MALYFWPELNSGGVDAASPAARHPRPVAPFPLQGLSSRLWTPLGVWPTLPATAQRGAAMSRPQPSGWPERAMSTPRVRLSAEGAFV